MEPIQKKFLALSNFLIFSLPLIYSASIYAAKPINLRHQSISKIHSMVAGSFAEKSNITLKETGRSVDFNGTVHIFIQETYKGYPVWGGDAAIHVTKGDVNNKSLLAILNESKSQKINMNGTIYENLKIDLSQAPAQIFTTAQAQLALQKAKADFIRKVGPVNIDNPETELVIYVDEEKQNKAHYAFKVTFDAESQAYSSQSYQPLYIMDAVSFEIDQYWDNLKTAATDLDNVFGGGNGGNIRMGKLSYDSVGDHLSKLNIQRDSAKKTCYWQNDDVVIQKYNRSSPKMMTFPCESTDVNHNGIYWIGAIDAINDGYGPASDALFAGSVIKDMYEKWYNTAVFPKQPGKASIVMVVHKPRFDNASWNGKVMTFGDGNVLFYPLTSLGVAAHEFSHAFTQHHSNLVYTGQSGGINESFSDMAAKAAEFYAYGKNDWDMASEIFKAPGKALRYLDQPSKDCVHIKANDSLAQCSIDDASQYYNGLKVHYSSGVFNRLFYLIATTPNWNVKKAFDVMVQANMSRYWTSRSNFKDAACGVLKATSDYGYSIEDVKQAISKVKIDISRCSMY